MDVQRPVSDPQTAERSVGYPDDDYQPPTEEASAEDAMGRKSKLPILKARYAKIAADDLSVHALAKGKGEEGKCGSAPPAANAPVASTSAGSSTSAATDSGATATEGADAGAGAGTSTGKEGSESQDKPTAEESNEPTQTAAKPVPRRTSLPYTFYNIHGKNITLCSSGSYHFAHYHFVKVTFRQTLLSCSCLTRILIT